MENHSSVTGWPKKNVNCLFTHEALTAVRVHMNSFKRARAFQIELEFGSVSFKCEVLSKVVFPMQILLIFGG